MDVAALQRWLRATLICKRLTLTVLPLGCGAGHLFLFAKFIEV